MRKVLVKMWLPLFGACVWLIAGVGCDPAAKPNQPRSGLYVENGKLMRNGAEFRAMGINYNACLTDLIGNGESRDFVKGFRILKRDYNVPYIRFNGGAYAHTGWALYRDHPDEYFRRFDLLVRAAEREGLGLIPSLFWYVCTMPDLAGEPVSALGDPNSKCRAFMREYIRDVVGRYKDSPAIWGWEVGNEWMLYADLPKLNHLPPKKVGTDRERTAEDKLFRPMILNAYEDFHRTVRELDPDRIIVTGDSIARAQAWHNRNEDGWGWDTRQQWTEIFRADTPSCYEVVSFHLYAEAEKKYFEQKNLTLEEFVKEAVAICRNGRKPIWCGELGMPGTDEASRDMFFRMVHAIEENEIELSAIWNFNPNSAAFQADWDICPSNERAYMLDAVKELNLRFAIGI